ncbi:Uncharacterized membrane protein YckC, RDD family [Anaerovirgula multivorans]|uniref:Uncharacterized membrane protein YckC, RDD family n=1 Tax=Anaerovirgula multivorans TaxID=312168 RepID=A0A239B8Y0_9FIRM|nr:RDD family protein [Anaerovirgula multivorans]SNS04415.1 Uncharacterized membrane protein YckC, RDD family [Anaerovirgula multivorans]
MSSNKIQRIIKRFIAMSIDMMLASILCIAFFFALLRFGYNYEIVLNFITMSDRGLSYFYLFFIVFYYTVLEAILGTTIGKKIFGLIIVTSCMSKPKVHQIIIRNLFRISDQILWLGSLTVIFDKQGRRLGDIIAKTMVISKKEAKERQNV